MAANQRVPNVAEQAENQNVVRLQPHVPGEDFMIFRVRPEAAPHQERFLHFVAADNFDLMQQHLGRQGINPQYDIIAGGNNYMLQQMRLPGRVEVNVMQIPHRYLRNSFLNWLVGQLAGIPDFEREFGVTLERFFHMFIYFRRFLPDILDLDERTINFMILLRNITMFPSRYPIIHRDIMARAIRIIEPPRFNQQGVEGQNGIVHPPQAGPILQQHQQQHQQQQHQQQQLQPQAPPGYNNNNIGLRRSTRVAALRRQKNNQPARVQTSTANRATRPARNNGRRGSRESRGRGRGRTAPNSSVGRPSR